MLPLSSSAITTSAQIEAIVCQKGDQFAVNGCLRLVRGTCADHPSAMRQGVDGWQDQRMFGFGSEMAHQSSANPLFLSENRDILGGFQLARRTILRMDRIRS